MNGDNLKLAQNVALIAAAMRDLASWLENTDEHSGTRYSSIALGNVSFSYPTGK